MAMTRERVEQLIARMEQRARANPRAYKLRVLAFALLGYAYLAGVLVLLLLSVVALVASFFVLKFLAVKLLWVLVPFVFIVATSLWVRIERPRGISLTRRNSPELFARIKMLRRKLRAPRVHHVVLTDDFNAAVVQVPRLGLFGWPANYLILGLPLMKALTQPQLDAVLAHELGHLVGGHARFGNWLYRLRRMWAQILDALEVRRSAGNFLFEPFFSWYVPRFHACSFPLARANEYQADAAAAKAVGPAALAEALTVIELGARWLHARHWPSLFAQADDLPNPPADAYSMLQSAFVSSVPADELTNWMDAAVARPSDCWDTHPSYADRLAAIGEQPRLPHQWSNGTADLVLGSASAELTKKLDSAWRQRVSEDWRRRHEHVKAGRVRLLELDAGAAAGELPVEDAVEHARLMAEFGDGDEAALVALRRLLERAADDALVQFTYGRELLLRDDADGIGHIQRAGGLDNEATLPGLLLLRDFHQRSGDVVRAKEFHRLACEREQIEIGASREREHITVSDVLDPHGISAEHCDALVSELRRVGVQKAWLARKRLKFFPENPLFLLGFSVRRFGFRNEKRARQLQRRINDLQLPESTLILCTDGKYSGFRRKLRRVKHSRLI